MAWFLPAWEELSEDERYVLENFYGGSNEYGSSVIYKIADHFHIEQSSTYNKKTVHCTTSPSCFLGKAEKLSG